jgi:hypothetical protein
MPEVELKEESIVIKTITDKNVIKYFIIGSK